MHLYYLLYHLVCNVNLPDNSIGPISPVTLIVTALSVLSQDVFLKRYIYFLNFGNSVEKGWDSALNTALILKFQI